MHACGRRDVERHACCRCNEASADVLLIHSVYICTIADEICRHVFLPLTCRSQTVPEGVVNACIQTSVPLSDAVVSYVMGCTDNVQGGLATVEEDHLQPTKGETLHCWRH